jgi:methionine synthase II (cobalamin-independent)
MRTSSGHILTSHAGSLPRPDDLIAAWGRPAHGATDEHAFAEKLRPVVFSLTELQNST